MYNSPTGQPEPGYNPYQTGAPAGYPPPVPAAPAPPARPKSKLPLVLGIVGGLLALCCVGGIVVAMVNGKQNDPTSAGGPTTSAAPSPSDSGIEVRGDLDKLRKGDCFVEKPGIVKSSPVVRKAACTDPGAYVVVLRVTGTADESACQNTDYTTYYYQDVGTKSDQWVLCVKPVK